MIKFVQKGNFNHTEKFLKKVSSKQFFRNLERYAQKGVDALASATPIDSGKTASSWSYEIRTGRNSVEIYWTNSNINKGVNIAVIIQYGHGTRNGGYVQGRDYINPAIQPIFFFFSKEEWKEVNSL